MSSQLDPILDLTDQVQNAIDAGEWQRAHELEIERRRLLEHLVMANAGSAGLGGALSALEQRNNGLIGIVRHHQRRILREAATVKTANAGAAVYASAPEDES